MSCGSLYVVATPIGNLNDLTPRAAKALADADFIAAEDTRVTMKLLSHLHLSKPMISYYAHNMHERGAEICNRIMNGENCALVTDAGTPAVSDPGEELAALCRQSGIMVIAVPGCCAAIAALSASGLPSGRFCFEGFLSVNKKNRREHLASLLQEQRTMIFYEAPHKLRFTLADLLSSFGDRRVFIARELTKLHEDCRLTTLAQAAAYYETELPRGEFVLCVEGAPAAAEPAALSADEAISQSKASSLRDSVRSAREKGVSRNEAYKAALKAKEKKQ